MCVAVSGDRQLDATPPGGEIFYTLKEVQVLTERWRWQYNHVRPHQALGYRPPAPEARDWPLAATREDNQPAIH